MNFRLETLTDELYSKLEDRELFLDSSAFLPLVYAGKGRLNRRNERQFVNNLLVHEPRMAKIEQFAEHSQKFVEEMYEVVSREDVHVPEIMWEEVAGENYSFRSYMQETFPQELESNPFYEELEPEEKERLKSVVDSLGKGLSKMREVYRDTHGAEEVTESKRWFRAAASARQPPKKRVRSDDLESRYPDAMLVGDTVYYSARHYVGTGLVTADAKMDFDIRREDEGLEYHISLDHIKDQVDRFDFAMPDVYTFLIPGSIGERESFELKERRIL